MAGSYSDGSSSDNDSWDLNLDPMDDEQEVSLNILDVEVHKRAVDLPAMEVMRNVDEDDDYLPKVGMIFQSEDHAYNFYNTYARRLGFSVRKGELKRLKSGRIYLREFLCSRQGSRAKHTRGPPKKPRPHTRTKCRACIRFKVKEDGTWFVRKFIEDHNHNFATQSEVHFLRSQRNMENVQMGHLESTGSEGSAPVQGASVILVENGGSQHLTFKQNEGNGCYQKRRREIYKEGDAQVALNYFRRMQKENPAFSYAIQVDQENQICNLFWADAKSKVDYAFFGDVVCFDTTFRTSKDSMPCAPIVGVDHHGSTVIFGCALLVDESTESFIWLFESFLDAMSGKPPKTILTDQAKAIEDAIVQVMPTTHHRFCLWHIYHNAAKHLFHVYESNRQFKKDFKKCIYNAETEEEFELDWKSMLGKYDLANNEWLRDLYEVRVKWALVYGREHFCAGMTTTQRSETINASFKGFLKGAMSVSEFVTQYEKAMAHMRQREMEEDFKSKNGESALTSRSSIEKQAAHVYSRNAFKTFQERFRDLACYLEQLEDERGSVYIYKVEMLDGVWHDRNRRVTFNADDITIECTCKSFEFTGILCVHALRVLLARRIAEIPSKYFLKRWTKEAKTGAGLEDLGTEPDCQNSVTSRYRDISYRAIVIAVKGAIDEQSITVVKRHLAACLDELDLIQREGEGHASQDIGRNNSRTDVQNTKDHVKKKNRGEPCKRLSKNAVEGGRSTKTTPTAKDVGSEPPFVSPSHGSFFPQPIICQASSANNNQPMMMHPSEAVQHFSQALFGARQSVILHNSELVPHVNQGQSGNLMQSVLMHSSQHVMHLNQEQSGHLNQSILMHPSPHIPHFNQI